MGITNKTPELQRARKRLREIEAELEGLDDAAPLALRKQVALEWRQASEVVQKYLVEQSRLERAKLRAEERAPRTQRFAHGTGAEGDGGFDPMRAHAEATGA